MDDTEILSESIKCLKKVGSSDQVNWDILNEVKFILNWSGLRSRWNKF